MIAIAFIYFRTTSLRHLDAAWYSLSRQDFTDVEAIWFLDNNTPESPEEIEAVLKRYTMPVPVYRLFDKHGDATRTHSWSVNHVGQNISNDATMFFTRSDYILDYDCLRKLRHRKLIDPLPTFVTGWCYQSGYDRNMQNVNAEVDIEQFNWRPGGVPTLMQHLSGYLFHETDQDAGVWLVDKHYLDVAPMNEQLSSWGFQQSTWQRMLRREGVKMVTIPEYLFLHQHHYADRDFARASSEYNAHGGGL